MSPRDWLSKNAPGFSVLPPDDRAAITDFTLLWSFFEAVAFRKDASTRGIVEFVRRLEQAGRLKTQPFAKCLGYFRARYLDTYPNIEDYMESLGLRKNDRPDMVKAMLIGKCETEADCIAALLIIVYRLRNNFFHGEKWAYGIKGQLGNFTHANLAMMAALDAYLGHLGA